ncbi:hypothetical protein F5051DRAFT_432199 [Lentinula edodes]|nr:hypothetical protein F5051DRAFT_432199 [Lentinula edodes]
MAILWPSEAKAGCELMNRKPEEGRAVIALKQWFLWHEVNGIWLEIVGFMTPLALDHNASCRISGPSSAEISNLHCPPLCKEEKVVYSLSTPVTASLNLIFDPMQEKYPSSTVIGCERVLNCEVEFSNHQLACNTVESVIMWIGGSYKYALGLKVTKKFHYSYLKDDAPLDYQSALPSKYNPLRFCSQCKIGTVEKLLFCHCHCPRLTYQIRSASILRPVGVYMPVFDNAVSTVRSMLADDVGQGSVPHIWDSNLHFQQNR